MEVWKILFLSKWVICRFHVNLPACRISFYERLHPYTLRSGGWPSIPGEGLGHEFLRHLERTKVTWVQPICWFLLIDVGMEFYLGIYFFSYHGSWNWYQYFFWEDLPFFSDVFFLLITNFLKPHFVVFLPQEPDSSATWSPKSPSPTKPTVGVWPQRYWSTWWTVRPHRIPTWIF